MLVVWLFVAPLEEVVFRGFLMSETARLLGTAPWATAINVVLGAVVFGLAHGYQGRSGVLSTGVAGALLGLVFVASGFDLWLAVLTHGFIDTVGIALIAVGADRALRRGRAAP
jgi:membrane protease YdiL (CAAX protease family)